jgi:site-specific DNA-methyltransferase (adenine-specific)
VPGGVVRSGWLVVAGVVIRREEIIGDCRLILGDCLEILPTLGPVDAVVTDPPYGMDWNTDSTRFSGGGSPGIKRAKIVGDAAPFDPSPILRLGIPAVMWGYNHLAQRLPTGKTLIWLKQNPNAYGEFLSDAELGWASGGNGVWAFYRPRSIATAVQEGGGKVAHPTQKPVALMEWCLGFLPNAKTILDPFMGSGTTLVACAKLGRKGIGIEIDEGYFDIACERVRKAYAQPDLFVAPPAAPVQQGMDL